MATETATAAEVEVTANAKCVAIMRKLDTNSAQGASLKIQLADTILNEAKRLGIENDKKAVRKMVTLSWREARDFKSSDEALLAAFDQTTRPDVSKVLTFVYPADDKAKAELDKGISHNEKVTTVRGRIGENRLLDIARGNLTFADAKAGKTAASRRGESTGATNTVVPPAEQFHNAISGLIQRLKLDLATVESVFAKVVAERKTS